MGHQRLGDIPKSQRWHAVVATIASAGGGLGGATSGTFVENVADRTLDAAAAGLERAISDAGLRFTFYFLTQIALASGAELAAAIAATWNTALRPLISVRPTSEMQSALDEHVEANGRRTDISEMAQQAAGEAIAALAGPNARTLFGSGAAELQDAMRQLSTRAGFARLGQRFFGRFMTRFLNFYISRVTAGQVGGANLSEINDVSRFNASLATHCHQSASSTISAASGTRKLSSKRESTWRTHPAL